MLTGSFEESIELWVPTNCNTIWWWRWYILIWASTLPESAVQSTAIGPGTTRKLINSASNYYFIPADENWRRVPRRLVSRSCIRPPPPTLHTLPPSLRCVGLISSVISIGETPPARSIYISFWKSSYLLRQCRRHLPRLVMSRVKDESIGGRLAETSLLWSSTVL